jgi:hypothetical protein
MAAQHRTAMAGGAGSRTRDTYPTGCGQQPQRNSRGHGLILEAAPQAGEAWAEGAKPPGSRWLQQRDPLLREPLAIGYQLAMRGSIPLTPL